MSFGGHVIDMINRIRYNESLKEARRQRYKKVKELYLEEFSKKHIDIVDKNNLSDAELKRLKRKIQFEILKERKRDYLFAVIIAFLIFAALLAFVLTRLKYFIG